MVNIDISIEDISRLMGLKTALTPNELDSYIAYAKAEVDSEPEGPDENGHTKIAIDIKTASRPDLWSAEGLAREARGMINTTGLPEIDFPSSDITVEVSKTVQEIRPYIAAFVAKGLKLNDFLIKQLIQAQDKVDFSFGRKRKRTSIGIYNLNMISSPIKYKTVPKTFKFVPLTFDSEMSITDILDQHPKGQEYRHILDPFTDAPILVDSTGKVLSMPPIINSNDVGRVTEATTDVLVEVTGTSYEAVIVVSSLFAQIMHDRHAKVSTVEIHYPESYEFKVDTTPPTKAKTIVVSPKDINNYLGTKFSKKKMINLLKKRRHNAKETKNGILVEYGPWRSDILHWVDISEEIAIAYGYNKLEPTVANIFTPGSVSISTDNENMIREILIGTGLQEIINYNLTDAETISSKMLRSEAFINSSVIKIKNPVTSTYGYLRPDLLSGMIRFVARNSEAVFPQRIFETGESVVRDDKGRVYTYSSATVVLAGVHETFETVHQILDTLFNLIGADYELEAAEILHFMSGRAANILHDGKIVGHIGEINLTILEGYSIKVPVIAFEIDLTKIPLLKIQRFYS